MELATHEAHTPECGPLPDELWALVLGVSGFVEVSALACTCRQLSRLAKAPRVWQALCLRYEVPVQKDCTDWRAEFRTRTIRMRTLQAEAHARRVRLLQAAVEWRRDEEAQLRCDLKRVKAKRAGIQQHLAEVYRQQQQSQLRSRLAQHTVWVPSAVQDALVAAQRSAPANRMRADWAAQALEQQLRDLDVHAVTLRRQLAAKQALAGPQQAELDRVAATLPSNFVAIAPSGSPWAHPLT